MCAEYYQPLNRLMIAVIVAVHSLCREQQEDLRRRAASTPARVITKLLSLADALMDEPLSLATPLLTKPTTLLTKPSHRRPLIDEPHSMNLSRAQNTQTDLPPLIDEPCSSTTYFH